jgi:cell division protein ZapE
MWRRTTRVPRLQVSPRPPLRIGMSTAVQRGPIAQYQSLVEAGKIRSDEHQLTVVHKLQTLHERLDGYNPDAGGGSGGSGRRSWLSSLFSSGSLSGTAPRGMYLHGDVGTGKTFLMDLFFATANVPRKRRVHFHQFMHYTHGLIHNLRVSQGGQQERGRRQTFDPIPQVAQTIADHSHLLCFDEFQVCVCVCLCVSVCVCG